MGFDGSGNIYVVDSENNRIQKFDSSGTYLSQWGSYYNTGGVAIGGEGDFNRPRAIAFDGLGDIYVADTANRRIQKFDPSGTFLAHWSTIYESGGAAGPNGIGVNSSDEIFIANGGHNTISKWRFN